MRLFVNREVFDVYGCSACGKVESSLAIGGLKNNLTCAAPRLASTGRQVS